MYKSFNFKKSLINFDIFTHDDYENIKYIVLTHHSFDSRLAKCVNLERIITNSSPLNNYFIYDDYMMVIHCASTKTINEIPDTIKYLYVSMDSKNSVYVNFNNIPNSLTHLILNINTNFYKVSNLINLFSNLPPSLIMIKLNLLIVDMDEYIIGIQVKNMIDFGEILPNNYDVVYNELNEENNKKIKGKLHYKIIEESYKNVINKIKIPFGCNVIYNLVSNLTKY
jgi:hypothetical protein